MPETGDYDSSDLLLVKADAGALDRVYGPTVFRQGADIILKIGANIYPIKQNKTEFICGDLIGSVEFSGEERKVKADKHGSKVDCLVQDCTMSFMGDGDDNIYQCAVRTEPLSNPIKSGVAIALKKNLPFSQFLSEPSTGGSSAFKMRDMEVNLPYILTKAELYTDGQYGDTYIVHTADGERFWAQGQIKTMLLEGDTIPNDFDEVTITSKEKSKDGSKVYVKMKLRQSVPA
jgi:hypothetical protein